MIYNSEPWLKRAEELIYLSPNGSDAAESVHFATSMLTSLYGAESSQMKQFREGLTADSKVVKSSALLNELHQKRSIGVLKGTIAELKAGLIVRLRVEVAGEVLVELIGVARDVLQEQSDAAKNTASVLVAATFESVMRRMGEEFAGGTSRPKLEEVINALKDNGILKGGEVGTALSYLKFRNDSLHADWQNVSRPQVESCLAFNEATLVKCFS